jgi:hypothetical protein
MYYYIFDPPVGPREYERTAHIKEALSNLGIAGEMTQPQPGKTVEDLVTLAASKRYSTIVAVGGMELVNRIAKAIEPYDVVFGIIPTLAHPDLASLIGTSDWKQAAEHLKRRRWKTVRLGTLNESACFLTPAHIMLPSDARWRIETPDFAMEGIGGELRVTPVTDEATDEAKLQIERVRIAEPAKGFFGKLLRPISTNLENTSVISMKADILTEKPFEVSVAGATLTTTPLSCSIEKRQIKLITAKATTVS